MASELSSSLRSEFDIVFVGQAGRLQYESLILAASIRAAMPEHRGVIYCLEPQPGPLWPRDPRIPDGPLRDRMSKMGVTFVPFESRHFGASYPQGNKIEGLSALPAGRAFLFLDSDSLVLRDLSDVPFDFNRPSASLRREPTWPELSLYGPDRAATWGALYARFGLDFESAQDLEWPAAHWKRYPYYNAGFFFGACPRRFGARFTEYAVALRDHPPPELVCQSLDPWLDQIVLPLVIHSFGGGPKTLAAGFMDGTHHCHYRTFPLLYARESDDVVATLTQVTAPHGIKKHLKSYEPALRMIYQGRGRRVRALFDRTALPRTERALRNTLRRHGYWMR